MRRNRFGFRRDWDHFGTNSGACWGIAGDNGRGHTYIDGRALSGLGVNHELGSDEICSLGHSRDAQRMVDGSGSIARWVETDAVILDQKVEPFALEVETHGHAPGKSVALDVRERLLGDAEHRQLGVGGQSSFNPGDPEGRLEALTPL